MFHIRVQVAVHVVQTLIVRKFTNIFYTVAFFGLVFFAEDLNEKNLITMIIILVLSDLLVTANQNHHSLATQ